MQTQLKVLLTELTLLPINRNIIVKPVPLFVVTSWDGRLLATSADYRLASQWLGKNEATIVLQPPTDALPKVALTLRMDKQTALELNTTLRNISAESSVGSFRSLWQFRIGDGDVYAYPFRTVIISSAENDFRYRYGGSLPLQFL